MTLPLSAPGIVAGTLLTFIPASGDYVNAQFLGGAGNRMIGNVIQSLYLSQPDYPAAAALSFVLMALILIVVFIYIRFAGSEALMGEEAAADERRARARAARLATGCASTRSTIVAGAGRRSTCCSRSRSSSSSPSTIPAGRYNFTWVGFTLEHWAQRLQPIPELNDALLTSLKLALLATVISTVLGTMMALALVRHEFFGRRAANFLIVIPMATPEVVIGAALLSLFLIYGTPRSASRRC